MLNMLPKIRPLLGKFLCYGEDQGNEGLQELLAYSGIAIVGLDVGLVFWSLGLGDMLCP